MSNLLYQIRICSTLCLFSTMKSGIIILLVFVSLIIIVLIYNYISTPASYSPDLNGLSVYAQHEKTIKINLDEDGSSYEHIIWKIIVQDILSYFPEGEWGILIPINSKGIIVKEKENEINFKIEKYSDRYSLLKFANTKPIKKNSDFFFEVSYEVERNPVVYNPFYFYERTITRLDTDETFDLSISLPKKAEIISTKKTPVSNEENTLSFRIEKNETTNLEINFKIPYKKPEIATISSDHYQATLPTRYASYYKSLLEEADEGYEILEEIYGFSPEYETISIEMINPESLDFEEKIGASHLGEGRIRMKITNLLKPEIENLDIILHETVHVFNSKYFENTGINHWFKEGTAVYYSEKILEQLGHDTSSLKKLNSEIIGKCENSDQSYISNWRPNSYLNSEEHIKCSGIQYSPIQTGYAQSYNIISIIISTYGENVISNFYKIAGEEKIKFSSNHAELNNQINEVLSEAVRDDTSSLLNSMGVEVEGGKTTITGLPIFKIEEPDTKTKLKILFVLFVAILIILIVKAKKIRKEKKVQILYESFSPYYKL